MKNAVTRAAVWVLFGFITVLTLVPKEARPVTGLPHKLEHFGIFALAGASFAVGYVLRIGTAFLIAIAYCAALEGIQIFVPGRHARLSDFVVDSAAACVGIVVGTLSKGDIADRTAYRARNSS